MGVQMGERGVRMKFLDLFAGIGGFRMGLESLGHECVGFCEIDKFARKSYKAIYDTEGEIELHDITEVTNEEWRKLRGTVDIICGGFPCQAFSIAGKREGFLDETRGTLFFEIARSAKEIKPPLLFLENVKGLLSHDKGRTFRTILSTFDELGYDAEWQVLNSKDFGVPQNRERVFIIGHLRGTSGRGRVGKQVANTLLTSGNQGVVTENLKIRKLTPRECWRLQGFPDWAFDKAQEVNSKTQLYKQAGNSVTVNVIKAIAERLEQ